MCRCLREDTTVECLPLNSLFNPLGSNRLTLKWLIFQFLDE